MKEYIVSDPGDEQEHIGMKEEIWVPLSKKAFGSFATFYEVSNFGNIRSKTRKDKSGRTRKGRKMKLWISAGYFLFDARYDCKRKHIKVHQAVYYSFNGGKSTGLDYVIDHIDENKLNNNLNNLQLLTHAENISKSIGKYDLPKHISARPYHLDRSRLCYIYQRYINKKNVALKQSVNLDKVIKFKKAYESINDKKNENRN